MASRALIFCSDQKMNSIKSLLVTQDAFKSMTRQSSTSEMCGSEENIVGIFTLVDEDGAVVWA